MLRVTLIGKTMRALSDSFDLAEVSGVNTRRVVLYTWLLAGSLAGLAGVLAAIYTTLTPNTGWFLLLPIFAAVVLGGIGNAYGALIGGVTLGLVQEWSTDVHPPDLQGGHRLPRADPGAARPAPGHLRPGRTVWWTHSSPSASGPSSSPSRASTRSSCSGLQLEVGDTGLINFGHVAFMAIGAYTMGLLVTNDVTIWIAIPIAIAAAAAGGLLLGLPTLPIAARTTSRSSRSPPGRYSGSPSRTRSRRRAAPRACAAPAGRGATPTTTSSTSSRASASSSTGASRCS